MKQNKIPKNEYIIQPKGKTNPYKHDVIYSDLGQWKYPGQVTRIPSNQITMQGVPYPVQGVDDTGYSQMMYPGMDYTFPGQYVTEYPMARYGGEPSLTNIEGHYKDGGFNNYEADLISKVLMNRNRDKDFVKRAYDVGAYPDSNMFTGLDTEDFGNRMSHKMSWGEDDSGQAYMYPDIYNPNNEAIKVPNQYADYISSEGYKKATGMIPERPFGGQNTKTHTHMKGGGSLNRKVTCSNCGWSWKLVDGGTDPMTCHKCGETIKMQNGGWLDSMQGGGSKIKNKLSKNTLAKGERSNQDNTRVFNLPIKTLQALQQQADVEKAARQQYKQQPVISQGKKLTPTEQVYSDKVQARIANPSNDLGIIGANMASALTRFRYLNPEEIAATTNNPSATAGLSSNIMTEALANEMVGPAFKEAFKNTYRINPWAEKLNNSNSSYRVAGLDAAKDFKNTGILRSKTPNVPEGALLKMRTMYRPTSFPSFQKGYADLRYLPDEGGVIFKTDLPTFKRGDINPVTGFPIKGRHYAHRVIDPKTGASIKDIPGADVKMYGSEPHWLKGYQEVPKQLPGSPVASSVDDVGNLANQFRKKPLSEKELEMYKWFGKQERFNKLPKTTNKESLSVLEDFKTRIQTPEGKRRMKELGIGSDEMLQKLDIVEDPNTFGYYTGDKNKIVMNPQHPLPKKVVRHEIEHGVQNAINISKMDKVNYDAGNFKYLFNPKKGNQAKFDALKPTSEIDDLLSGLELRREGTPNKVWKDHVDQDIPVNINDYKPAVSNKQNATDYFLTGSEGREKSAFLGEVQQYMMDAGTIPKKGYVEITPEMVKNTMVDAMFDEKQGGNLLRLFNIMKASDANYNLVAKGLNKMLSVTGAAIGTGTALQEEEDGGWLDSYDEGGEKPWGKMTPKERTAYLDNKEAESKSREQAKKEYYKDWVAENYALGAVNPLFATVAGFSPLGIIPYAMQSGVSAINNLSQGNYLEAGIDAAFSAPLFKGLRSAKKTVPKVKQIISHPTGKMEGLASKKDIGKKYIVEGPGDTPYHYVPNAENPKAGLFKPMFGYKDWMHGASEVPSFNEKLNKMMTTASFGKRPLTTDIGIDREVSKNALMEALDNARYEEGITDLIPTQYMKQAKIPYNAKKAFQNIQPNKYGGFLEDEYRRGGQKKKRYTSKNIQSSVNDLFMRNETLFGPVGKKRYKPGLKYKSGGGWLDNLT